MSRPPGAEARDLIVEGQATPGLVRRLVGALVPSRTPIRGTVYLLLDHSTSMGEATKMTQLRVGAVRFFLEALQREYAVGAVAFGDEARVVHGADRDAQRFWRRLRRLRPYGRTNMVAALDVGARRLRRRGGHRVLILITDGKPDDREGTLAAAARARASGLRLVTIGTDRADEAFLRRLAGHPELARYARGADLADAMAATASHLDEA